MSDETPSPTVVYSRDRMAGIAAVIDDLLQGLAMHRVWRAFARDEIEKRYRRSALGIAWMVVSYIVFVGAIALFFGATSSLGAMGFTAYVAIGFAAFNFVISNLNDGCFVFRSSATWIKSASMPYSIYIFKGIARALLPFVIQFASGLILIAILGWRPSPRMALVVPAIAVYLLNAVWVQLLLGLLAARWRDLAHLTQTITRLLFFASPIIWVYAEQTDIRKTIAGVNPFTHYIDIMRAPILGDPFIEHAWWVVAGVTLGGWAVALLVAAKMRPRLPFWI